jgi:IS30 family transposase
MVLASTSAAGVRFLASIKEGRGLKRSAREAGVHQEVGYRWLRECYLRHRRNGATPAEAEALLGFSSVRVAVWETEVANRDRHHLRVDVAVEAAILGCLRFRPRPHRSGRFGWCRPIDCLSLA